MIKRLPAVRETRVQSLVWEDPRRRKWQPTAVLLPGESHGQRRLAGYSPHVRKESDTTERLHSLTRSSQLQTGTLSSDIPHGPRVMESCP